MVFFFFQAEDGIRDWSVTGVQTCALPIWIRVVAREPGATGRIARRGHVPLGYYKDPDKTEKLFAEVGGVRSEERRVGKECRCRWSTGPCRKRAQDIRGRRERRQRATTTRT